MRIFVCVLAAVVFSARAVHAQGCSTTTGGEAALQACNATLQDVLILQPHIGIGLAGGNPVAGASSTLGMRIGRVPRISLGARVTGVDMDTRNTGLNTALNVDVGVGIFSGLTLLPTIGGFGSLDLLGSAGKLYLSDRVSSTDPGSWALGVRLGVLRESFTAPGVSVTGMYRRIGDVEFASAATGAAGESYALDANSVTSIRAIIGKRLFVVGATAGIGYDSFKSDMRVSAVLPTAGMPLSTAQFSGAGRKSDRMTVFANVAWTMLILHLVAEGGWQEGGERFGGPLPSGVSADRSESSTYYGSLAIRLAL